MQWLLKQKIALLLTMATVPVWMLLYPVIDVKSNDPLREFESMQSRVERSRSFMDDKMLREIQGDPEPYADLVVRAVETGKVRSPFYKAPPVLVEALARRFEGSSPRVRRFIAETVAVSDTELEPLSRYDRCVASMLGDSDPEVRRWGSLLIAGYPWELPPVIKNLQKSSNPEARRAVALGLSWKAAQVNALGSRDPREVKPYDVGSGAGTEYGR